MPLPKNEAWFPAKTFGWGWGLPSRWQGWVVMLASMAALIAGAPLARQGAVIYAGYSFALVAVLIAIAYWRARSRIGLGGSANEKERILPTASASSDRLQCPWPPGC